MAWQAIDEVGWTSPPLFFFEESRDSLRAKYGAAHGKNLDSKGVGLFDAWWLRFDCGLEVAIWCFHDNGDARPISDSDAATMEIHSNETERTHLLYHLELGAATIAMAEPNVCFVGEATWRVMRLDDNGNQYELTKTTSRCEAISVAAKFEARGHKQMYWVERGSND